MHVISNLMFLEDFLSSTKIFSDMDLEIMVVYADFEEMMINAC